MAIGQKSLNDVITALNSGELSMDELLGQLSTEKQYVRRGTSYSELKYDGVSFINGAPAKIFTVASEKIDRNGVIVERKSRNGNSSDETA